MNRTGVSKKGVNNFRAYPHDCFRFTENFLRMTFPNAWDLSEDEEVPEVTMQDAMQDSMQVTMQVEQIIQIMQGQMTRDELQEVKKIVHPNFYHFSFFLPISIFAV
jgi:ATP-dependent DNA helicase RecG